MLKKREIPADDSGTLTGEPADSREDARSKKPRWLRWILNLIDTIVTVFS